MTEYKKNPNIYDSLTEANFRLRGTIVMYEKTPYNVIAVADHKDDGVFRIYIQKVVWDDPGNRPYPPVLGQYGTDHPGLGTALDDWLDTDAGKQSEIIRKKMDSIHFDKFRPFPLGMCNYQTHAFYMEWSPQRHQHQGLVKSAVVEELVTLHAVKPSMMKASAGGYGYVGVHTQEFYDCIRGSYPSATECLEAMNDPEVVNDAVAFHRHFAFVKGPVEMLFLAYKSDVIAALPHRDFSKLRLGKKFRYTREVIEELHLFNQII